MTELPVIHVHLFLNTTLLGTIEVAHSRPADHYDFNGTRYRSISYMEVTERNGRRGYDVQVTSDGPADPVAVN